MSVYEFTVATPANKQISLEQYKGKVVIIANTASKCGLTPQYGDLETLYKEYREQGLEILGFPCNQFGGQEPGSSEEAESFCQVNYGVTFPVFAKVEVNGEGADPLFQYLKEQQPGAGEDSAIQWNFTKFLINRDGQVVERFEPKTSPETMVQAIKELL
ncbi:glutathione peroxidase [Paenibacillus macquariensis]|uniref:Glutathione peroxidase n=1 Tax=Paenibacillus macquariensis TaxID=948756 RepID=A0ABY1K9Q0_9BACL|nr:glutathione peroxidase [Paenibacillus macquariensis]MEC0092444.1 glutathione peroxidase [Paenibacillus macquariensis]OAB35407.1 glutathione peroxidase [Paenibacillus macquariensis subsp. macquariensis]SIR47309.1 glutathione peroxidase [Paenibacillus macquariensis]